MTALVADVGGTKSQLRLISESGTPIHEITVLNRDFPSFEDLLGRFMQKQPAVRYGVIAVAGPVDHGKRCQMTNLPWILDADNLCRECGFHQVMLLNDLQATAWGMTDPDIQHQLAILRGTGLNFKQPVVVISPGTGLGEACILPHPTGFVISATEGGHKSVAPFNARSAELVHQHWQQHDFPPSWENWFSGSGFADLYRALYPELPVPDNATLGREALADTTSPAGQCMQLFAEAIYAEAGNLVLQYLAWGGIIVAGGIPPKLEHFFQQPAAIDYVHKKNEYVDRLARVPVALCRLTEIPLAGAARFLQVNLQNPGVF
ncbi:MAG: glucokinase [Pseudomonadota bacterium]|nr:hypothetical protein [Pseudomonadales bacterium]MDY6922192.1 glucokinase [Pseudomonadota bacterium]